MSQNKNMAKRPDQETFGDKMKYIVVLYVFVILLTPFAGLSLGMAFRTFMFFSGL